MCVNCDDEDVDADEEAAPGEGVDRAAENFWTAVVVGEDVDVLFVQASPLERNIVHVLASVPDPVGGFAKSGGAV